MDIEQNRFLEEVLGIKVYIASIKGIYCVENSGTMSGFTFKRNEFLYECVFCTLFVMRLGLLCFRKITSLLRNMRTHL